jgi:hypothetical protein
MVSVTRVGALRRESTQNFFCDVSARFEPLLWGVLVVVAWSQACIVR